MEQKKFSSGQSFLLFLSFISFLASLFSVIYLNVFYSILLLTFYSFLMLLFGISEARHATAEDKPKQLYPDHVLSDTDMDSAINTSTSSEDSDDNDDKKNDANANARELSRAAAEILLLNERLTAADTEKMSLEAKLATSRQMLRELEAARSALQTEHNKAMASAISQEVCLFDYSLLKHVDDIDVLEAAEHAISQLKSFAELNNVQVRVSSREEQLVIKMNSRLFQILFKNIIDNSIKYMRRPGNLLITISRIEDDIFFIFKDDGLGLPLEELDFIFDLNFQGSNRVSGNGLGLPQAKAIVVSYNGTIFAKSNVNQGMGIYIQLPMENNSEVAYEQ